MSTPGTRGLNSVSETGQKNLARLEIDFLPIWSSVRQPIAARFEQPTHI